MPGRKYSAESEYRYGFNGKENDKDVSEGIQDYGMRIYDGRIGKFLSVDPLTQSYPWYTPYQFSGNTPIQAVDLDGAEEYHYLLLKDNDGSSFLVRLDENDVYKSVVVKWGLTRGGNVPLETRILKNTFKKFTIHRLSEIVYKGADNKKFTYTYEETVSFNSYNEAINASDEDFENTADDYLALIASGAAISTGLLDESEIEEGDNFTTRFHQTGGKRKVGNVVKNWSQKILKVFEQHHITPRSLRNLPFVKKAIQGGFKINSLKNLTPLEKFFKHAGTGVHAKHPKYTAQIANYLSNLRLSNYSNKQASDLLLQLNNYILKQIKKNKGVKLNEINLELEKFKPKK